MTEVVATDSNFRKEVIEKSKKTPIVVDFWAVWCGPCRLLGPVLERMAKNYNGKFVLAKVDVDANQKLGAEYGIMSIPAVKLFKGGEIVDEFVGAWSEDMIKEWLEKNGIK
ncbi:MAG: thioredoxin [archaeon]